MRKWTSVFALLGSSATIFCCFLPAVFVAVGAGAAFATVLGAFPQLVWLSENKALVFGAAALGLVLAMIVERRSRNAACPIDPALAAGCRTAKRGSNVLLVVATAMYGIGFFFAFVLPRLTA